ncbi:MAG: M24 family metallopeptidase [Thermodesulfobacteriota bacterium]
MDENFHKRNLAELRRRLDDRAADTLWVVRPENRRYLCGFRAGDVQLDETSGYLLVTRDHALLVTDSRYTTEAEEQVVDAEVVTISRDFVECLPDLLKRLGTRTLGFEPSYLTWGLHRRVARALKEMSDPVKLLPVKGLVEGLREIKAPEEIEAMERASDLMASVLDEVIPRMRPGHTEKEIAWQIMGLARDGGADSMAFDPIVASGPNGALPHALPSDRALRPGEPVVVDVGVRLDGYCCDMTRTVFPGNAGPLEPFPEVYRTVRKAQLAALDAVRPGVETTRPDGVAREIIREAGYGDYFGHSLGHGVGLAAHEDPRLAPRKPVKLRRGHVVTVEPGIYLPGKGGVRLEEMVVVEKSGPKILTRAGHFLES